MRIRTAAWRIAIALLTCGAGWPLLAQTPSPALGRFEGETDIGAVSPPGSAHFDAASGSYTLTSAGANTWYHHDDFHFLWRKASGDVALTAQISFPPHAYAHEPNPHRKGILMFRQTLDSGGVYADVAVHGSGLTALQYRRERGANSQDIELNIDAPKALRLEKRGDTFTLYLSMQGEPLHQVGASISLHLTEPFYVGLAAVSHDVATTDRVQFAQVSVEPLAPLTRDATVLYSTLLTGQTEDQYRRSIVIRSVATFMQSANWAPDGHSIYVHEAGRIQKIPYLTPEAGGPPQPIDTAGLVECSGNFGLSPDGHSLAVSCARTPGGLHQVFVLPAGGGGTPRQVTQGNIPSYFHAWSPDSRTIAFTRGKADRADIFSIPAAGGAEHQLTHDTLNDGPDYTPDGKYIYFDSARSGTLQIWRMRPDGTGAEQITDDAQQNHSPHVSPDGKSVAFLSQSVRVIDALAPTRLRIMSLDDGLIRTIADFPGDRGSFSMYGWGNANHLAYVVYQRLPK